MKVFFLLMSAIATFPREGSSSLIMQKTEDRNVVCLDDDESSCSTGETCCLTDRGTYGCCPHGFTCDLHGMCNKVDTVSPTTVKLPPGNGVAFPPPGIVCPDGVSQCPRGMTCCIRTYGNYGCCPFSNAVCCTDPYHCCPSGYRCDGSNGCTRHGVTMLQSLKLPAEGEQVNYNLKPALKLIQCPSGLTWCPAGSTCCLMSEGMYGCCPFSSATCCLQNYCCPVGFHCGPNKTCYKENAVFITLNYLPPLSRKCI